MKAKITKATNCPAIEGLVGELEISAGGTCNFAPDRIPAGWPFPRNYVFISDGRTVSYDVLPDYEPTQDEIERDAMLHNRLMKHYDATRAQVAAGRATPRTDAVIMASRAGGVSEAELCKTVSAFAAELERENRALRDELRKANSKEELIICPSCGSIQQAAVEAGYPFAIMVHTCGACGFDITESDWQPVAAITEAKIESALQYAGFVDVCMKERATVKGCKTCHLFLSKKCLRRRGVAKMFPKQAWTFLLPDSEQPDRFHAYIKRAAAALEKKVWAINAN